MPSTQRWAAITFHQACSYLPNRRTSPSIGQYQIIMLGDSGTWVWTTYSTAHRPGLELNSWPLSHQSDALATRLSSHLVCNIEHQNGTCSTLQNRISKVIYLKSRLWTLEIFFARETFEREFRNKNFQCERGLIRSVWHWRVKAGRLRASTRLTVYMVEPHIVTLSAER